MEPRGQRCLVFRPSRWLGALSALAGALWVGIFAYLTTFDGVPVSTYLSALAFIVLFVLSVVYHVRTAILVDAQGLTYRGLVRQQRLPFSDVARLDVVPGPITIYAVTGRSGRMQFSNFFERHRSLAEIVVERAGLQGR